MKIQPKEYEHCLRCGRKLKNAKARKTGYGTVCLKKLQTDLEFKKLFYFKNKRII